MKHFISLLMISALIVVSACSSKSQEESNDDSEQVRPSPSSTNSHTSPQMPTTEQQYQNQPSSSPDTSTRSDAYQLAFNSGKQLGYSDGLKGINDCYSAASAYTDDWIKQAFIQGYEMGQAEAGFNSSAVEYEEVEYDDGGYYYEDEY